LCADGGREAVKKAGGVEGTQKQKNSKKVRKQASQVTFNLCDGKRLCGPGTKRNKKKRGELKTLRGMRRGEAGCRRAILKKKQRWKAPDTQNCRYSKYLFQSSARSPSRGEETIRLKRENDLGGNGARQSQRSWAFCLVVEGTQAGEPGTILVNSGSWRTKKPTEKIEQEKGKVLSGNLVKIL